MQGIEELFKEFDKLENRVKNKIAKQAVDESSDVMLNALKDEAPQADKNSQRSFSHLNKDMFKKSGGYYAKMGINKSNWQRTKGLKIAPLNGNIY